MSEDKENIQDLLYKLESLLMKQESFVKEIQQLKDEVNRLKSEGGDQTDKNIAAIPDETIKSDPKPSAPEKKKSIAEIIAEKKGAVKTTPKPSKPLIAPKHKRNIEKFIGENLISVIGIIVVLIGVIIGAKLAIDRGWVNPLTRIIFGYLIGFVLITIAIKLKAKYEKLSAVILSGAMATLYFITFFAYDFYNLIPQSLTFGLMVVFTAFTVVSSIQYNRSVIAHIGLVGAYAVPFLLSDGSGRVAILFSYMAIINAGILVIGFKKYWKSLFYSAFAATWLIYGGWYLAEYFEEDHYSIAIIFLFVFFSLFYATFLAYKLVKLEKLGVPDILMIVLNSFIFFGIGYSILAQHETGEQLLGVFTLLNAVVHFIISLVIYKKSLADRNLFYMISGLVLIFITAAVPIQLDGSWVTVIWAFEAALLFWIGRTKKVSIYEKLSFPLMLFALISIFQDWEAAYNPGYYGNTSDEIIPILNVNFLVSVLFIAAFGFIQFTFQNKRFSPAYNIEKGVFVIARFIPPAILLIVGYMALRMEIASYWSQLYVNSEITTPDSDTSYGGYLRNYDLRDFRSLWVINYSLIFFTVLTLANKFYFKNQLLNKVSLILNLITIVVFMTQGLYLISELRESYVGQFMSEYYHRGIMHIMIRYISLVCLGVIVYVTYRLILEMNLKNNLRKIFHLGFLVMLLWVLSSELIHWLDIAGFTDLYKLGLSILSGVFALTVIAFGILKNKKYLRISAISLFGFTLLKLFFYDLTKMGTISKMIVLLSLGALLLIISFLYNKYKHLIIDENED